MSCAGQSRKVALALLIWSANTFWMALSMPTDAFPQSLGALGGIVGISGTETTEATPLFTMTGTPSFREGEGSLNFAYLNTRITRKFGENIEDPNFQPNFGPDVAAEITSRVFVMSYGVTDLLTVGVVLPFDTIRIRQGFGTNGDGLSDTVAKEKSSGLANPSFSAKYTLIRNPAISVRGALKLPTGFEAGSEDPEVDLDLAYSVSLGIADLHLQVGYQYTLESRLDQNPTDVMIANAALASGFGENFVFFTELNYRQAGGSLDTEPQINEFGVKERQPTQKSLDLVPGFKARFQKNLVFTTAARIALLNDFQFGYDYSYIALLSFLFST